MNAGIRSEFVQPTFDRPDREIVRCTNSRFSFAISALLYGSYSVCKIVNSRVVCLEVRAGMLGYLLLGQTYAKLGSGGISREGQGRGE